MNMLGFSTLTSAYLYLYLANNNNHTVIKVLARASTPLMGAGAFAALLRSRSPNFLNLLIFLNLNISFNLILLP